MKSELRIIGLMFFVLLLTACSKDGDSPDMQPVINVYVYSPDHPTITRGVDVAPINNESTIYTLQIWVFEHETGKLVSYYKPTSVDNLKNAKGVTYQLNVSDAFAEAKPKPTVDVYVVANAASCGLTQLTNYNPKAQDNETQHFRSVLEEAKIGSAYFGLDPLTSAVPSNGLPMSGVLRDVAVTGSAPVFEISSVKLTRAVSKLRFIFSKDNVETPVKITGIKLGVDLEDNLIPLIPTAEFLFLKADHSLYNISGSYVTPAVGGTELLPDDSPLRTDIYWNEDPLKYTYQAGQDAQDYEDLIAAGVEANKLSDVGPYYLRETDKKLSGVITYQIGDNTTDKKAKFEMKNAGDFSRNHTWIVYAYYGVDGMKVESVYSQEWNEVETEDVHNWYNW